VQIDKLVFYVFEVYELTNRTYTTRMSFEIQFLKRLIFRIFKLIFVLVEKVPWFFRDVHFHFIVFANIVHDFFADIECFVIDFVSSLILQKDDQGPHFVYHLWVVFKVGEVFVLGIALRGDFAEQRVVVRKDPLFQGHDWVEWPCEVELVVQVVVTLEERRQLQFGLLCVAVA